MNVDLFPVGGADLLADAGAALPFATGCAEAVYAEHFLEHLPLAAALGFLAESARVLAPGGVLRLSTPNLDWVTPCTRSAAPTRRPRRHQALHLNRAFYGWGHQLPLEPFAARHGARRLRPERADLARLGGERPAAPARSRAPRAGGGRAGTCRTCSSSRRYTARPRPGRLRICGGTLEAEIERELGFALGALSEAHLGKEALAGPAAAAERTRQAQERQLLEVLGELARLRAHVARMEASRFWWLHERWWALRHRLGLMPRAARDDAR